MLSMVYGKIFVPLAPCGILRLYGNLALGIVSNTVSEQNNSFYFYFIDFNRSAGSSPRYIRANTCLDKTSPKRPQKPFVVNNVISILLHDASNSILLRCL